MDRFNISIENNHSLKSININNGYRGIDKKRDIKLIPEMLNLLGCTKDNFKKLIQKMNYKAYEKDNEIYFQYNPRKEKVKKIFKKVKIEDSPFKILKEMNLK